MLILLGVTSCASGQPGVPTPPGPAAGTVAIVGASVVDMTGGPAVLATIIIEGDRISEVGPAERVVIPAAARVIHAPGAFVIPGLWDMHAHTTYASPAEVERAFFPVLVAHGVLGIRDPASRFPAEQTRQWRSGIAEGRILGPRLAALGRVVDARSTTIGAVLARNEVEARTAAQRLRHDAYDFAKPYNDLSAAAYRALAEEATRLGLGLAGHLPYAVDASEASDRGQRSIEHLTNLWFEVASAEDVIRERILAGLARDESPVALFQVKIDSLFPLAFGTDDPEKERELFARFVRNGTWQVPTLVVDRHFAAVNPPDAAAQRLLPRWVRESGRPLDQFLASLTPLQRATLTQLYRREAAMVGRMQRAGVGILAGTDAPLAYVAPGAALHDELEALVRDAGLTPLEALRAATVNAVAYLGAADSLGTVTSGKAADMVLLDADPTENIGNVRQIRAVIVGGRYLDRMMLDTLLAGVERAATRR